MIPLGSNMTDEHIRCILANSLPASLLVVLAIRSSPGSRLLSWPWTPFLSLSDAEAYECDSSTSPRDSFVAGRAPTWVTFLLIVLAGAELIAWTGVASFRLIAGGKDDRWFGVCAAILALTWAYAAVKPVLKSKSTPSYDLFALYALHLIGFLIMFGGILYEHSVYSRQFPPSATLFAYLMDFTAIVSLLVVMLSRPVGEPSANMKQEEIGKSINPEDYTTFWRWISFTWVDPLISRGTHRTLNENDVWNLSPSMSAKPVFLKFSELKHKTLLRHIWAANSFDISVDIALHFANVLLTYSKPFFLKHILEALGDPRHDRRVQAYIFACLMFFVSILWTQVDLQHFWFGRRSLVRIRSQLMSSIYDKALRRKDFSGVVETGGEGERIAAEKAGEPKSGADVGKIVNLMAVDVNQIVSTVNILYYVCTGPFEILLACAFLYQLLGWSAFVAVVILIMGSPFNNIITRRAVRISKGLLAARDKRMSILNEVIGAIKFIKFTAWEDRFIQRVLEARRYEIEWLTKFRTNAVLLRSLAAALPISVSVLSFTTFVWGGNELTLDVAFTAIILFRMIRLPLSTIPTSVVQISQTLVALRRIETFLNEDEVSEQVSSIKRASASARDRVNYTLFGLRNASFRWNAVDEKRKEISLRMTSPSPLSSPGSSHSFDPTNESNTGRLFELSDISVVFPDGELSVISGPTASGKSALLLGLLGEMTLLPGGEILMSKETEKVDEHGLIRAISFAAQTPWLQHQSIKDNILFGSHFDEVRYNAVVECCALGPDFRVLEDGDLTEIGARGVTLSGGQKSRVALARAVYARTKYVLLDDPLSAVDSHTARFLYERLLMGPLMEHRTVVLVTHHVELVLPGTHYLVHMLNGRINVQGVVKELRSRGVLDSIILDVENDANKAAEDHTDTKATEANISGGKARVELADAQKINVKSPRKLIEDEERESGNVKWVIYNTYLKASSYWIWAILVTIVLVVQLLSFTERYWIMVWGEAYGNSTESIVALDNQGPSLERQTHLSDALASHSFMNHQFASSGIRDRFPPAQDHPYFYVGVYALIGLTTVVVNACSVAAQYTGALRASRNLFKRLLNSVVHATMRWHDKTSSGRMLNRFSKDIETIDTTLASSLQELNSSLANFASSIAVVVIVFPLYTLPASILAFIYYRMAIAYLNTSRDLRRMEATSRSPIFSGFAELLEGVVTVRAFSAEHRFRNSMYSKIDLTLRMWYNFWMLNRWLNLRFSCLGATALFVTNLFALSGLVDAGWAALSITSTMALTGDLYWACRFWTSLELELNSVERVVEYLDLPKEPQGVIENSRPPAHWPSNTGPNENALLVVENLTVRYAPELPDILHNVSFALKARERVGILGRTGSGKSTLAMSILRFVDPTEGRILIDGVDITSIGVHDLRSRLTFIPQDATLFSGTLRDNLDPFGDFSDEECIDALCRVQLIYDHTPSSERSSPLGSQASFRGTQHESNENVSRITSEVSSITATNTLRNDKTSPNISLDSEVSAGGLNFSAGQRQLIAMARALLRRSSVIILDEATSSIDFETDARIQNAIREEFRNSLLITVAHRLRTIIDYDRLVVLDQGKVVEFDTPWNLIRVEGGIFRAMCLKSGSFSELEQAARVKASTRR